MDPELSLIPPRHLRSLSDGHLAQAMNEYRRVERLLARNPSRSGAQLRRQLRATLSLLEAEMARRTDTAVA